MSKKIPYGYHLVDDDDINYVIKSLKKYSITQGDYALDFGQNVANYTGAKYGLAVSSGTAALHLSLASLNINPGDEIITCPMSFCATSNVILYEGGKIVFVDIDKDTLNIDINKIEEKITKKTKAIMPIDFRGHPADLYELHLIAKKYNLKIIEDGSHSIGSSYKQNNESFMCGDGKHADLCTFSFHPVKHITTGEGGLITTNDKKLFKKITSLSKHGIDRREEMFSKEKRIGSWFYEMENLGYNYRMNEMQAALGLSQLKKIEIFKKRRREICDYYNSEFINNDFLITPHEEENVDSNFHIYVLQVNTNKYFDRYDLYYHLIDKGYLPMVHYIPIHLLGYYKDRLNYKKGDFPICENYYNRSISIPLYPSLSDEDTLRVVEVIKSFIKNKTSK